MVSAEFWDTLYLLHVLRLLFPGYEQSKGVATIQKDRAVNIQEQTELPTSFVNGCREHRMNGIFQKVS